MKAEAADLMYTAHFGNDTIYSLGPKLGKLKPDKTKHASILSTFKAKTKFWNIKSM